MKPKKTFNYARFGYIFSIPFVIAWLIFSLYPICYTIFIGFTDLQGAGASTAHVLWGDIFKNFKSILFVHYTFYTHCLLQYFVPPLIIWWTDKENFISIYFSILHYTLIIIDMQINSIFCRIL